MMMKDEGKYIHLWMKYESVIRVLLKKTDNENQKLQLYQHEFEKGGHKAKSGYVFSFEVLNGKFVKKVSTTAVAGDLVQILGNNSAIKDFLKDRHVKISMEKTFELQLEKIIS
jgi:hypothetical protein